ncbi:substrate-binding domain-containing protein [Anaerolentibacter hominis]|uniref:substrate-binding domain-containing protein n=1 Tax=Anaerolentibacter hominis TaxID=3079009 RepID=UPI0031B88514
MKKYMKKMLALLLVLAMTLSLTACAKDEKPADNDGGATADTDNQDTEKEDSGSDEAWSKDTKMVIGFSQNKLAHPFRVAGVEQLKAYVQEQGLNWEIIVTDGKNDATTQTANIEDLISQGVDAIICCPVTADTMATAATEVMDAGIPLILVNRNVSNDDYTCAITGSNYMIGQKSADDMAKRLDGKGKVAMIEGTLGASDTTDRAKGFLETIANYPDIEVIADVSGDFAKDKGMACMEDILVKYPDIDGVFCHNDEMAQGAYMACEAAGADDVLIYGNDCYKSTLDMIKEGKIAGTTAYPTSVQSAVDVLVKIFENGGVYDGEKEIVDDVPIATKENADDFYGVALDA